jgi:hypothetical protein
MRKATVLFAVVAVALLAAAGCGSSGGYKPELNLQGNQIWLDDGRTIQLRVWDADRECYRPLSSDSAELTGPSSNDQTSADVFLDVSVESGCDPSQP